MSKSAAGNSTDLQAVHIPASYRFEVLIQEANLCIPRQESTKQELQVARESMDKAAVDGSERNHRD